LGREEKKDQRVALKGKGVKATAKRQYGQKKAKRKAKRARSKKAGKGGQAAVTHTIERRGIT